MRLKLDTEGNPISSFAATLSGRRIDLMAGGDGSHPLQLLGPRSRGVASAITAVLDALDGLPFPLEGAKGVAQRDLCDAFRRLTYDATELFDLYAQMLPARLARQNKRTAKEIAEYKRVATRLRHPWSLLCNKFKHSGASLAFNRCRSEWTGEISDGYIVLSPQDGASMFADKQVHTPPERRASYLRKLFELTHAILRTDLNAAKLIKQMPDDDDAQPITERTDSYPFGIFLGRLNRSLVILAEEPATFDGFKLSRDTVELVKCEGRSLRGPIKGTTMLRGDGYTNAFSFR